MSTKQLEQQMAKLETEFEQMKADFRCASSKDLSSSRYRSDGAPMLKRCLEERM
jgi:hypothetical protein